MLYNVCGLLYFNNRVRVEELRTMTTSFYRFQKTSSLYSDTLLGSIAKSLHGLSLCSV